MTDTYESRAARKDLWLWVGTAVLIGVIFGLYQLLKKKKKKPDKKAKIDDLTYLVKN